MTTKTAGLPGPPKVYESGNMFFFETNSGELLSEYRNPRRPTTTLSPGNDVGEYCSSHLGIPVPAVDRYLLVNAYYRGGSSVIDFSDPTNPKEIAFADMDGTNTWSAYTYPRRPGAQRRDPGLLQRRPEPQLRAAGHAGDYPEAAYGFQRFRADVGRRGLVGFDRLNPQLQERVIPNLSSWRKWGKPWTYDKGEDAPPGARNHSARPVDK